jgi:hypothetical protein
MTHQRDYSALGRDIGQSLVDVLTDPDFQCVLSFALIGLLIMACLSSAFPLDDNALSSIALLS